MHHFTAWFLAWGALALCLALDTFGLWTLAGSPQLGARFRTRGNSVLVTSVESGSALQQAGIRRGDTLLSLDGRPVDAAAFLDEPEDYASWRDRDLFWDWQHFAMASTARGSVEMTCRHGLKTLTVRYPVEALGWTLAWERSAALRLVGWVFLLVSFLIWTKKRGECSLLLFLAGIGVFASFCTAAVYMPRDFCLSPAPFAALAAINYAMSLTAILTLHLGWIFPTYVSWLVKLPWMRILPWALCAFQLAAHESRIFFLPPPVLYILISLALLGFMLTVVIRLVRATDPILKSQLKWVALAGIGGFLPFIVLTGLPAAFGIPAVPENLTLLSAVITPVCLSFAIFRYRLLDVEHIFDWVLVHSVVLAGFALFELAVWTGLSSSHAPQTISRPLLIASSMFFVAFLYAPARSALLRLLTRLSGRTRPSLTDSLRMLLDGAYAEGDPRKALELALQWTLKPSRMSWVHPDQVQDALLQRMENLRDGLLGYEFGQACPSNMESTAWVPVQTGHGVAAIVLWPQGAQGWNRQDLRIARNLGRFGEPLLKMQNMQHEYSQTTNAMREQREELLREMHDGLGSQLFGASLLTKVSGGVSPAEMQQRMAEANVALLEAMDSLRTGLTVLSSPPGAFGPTLLALLMRGEHVLNAAGIHLETKIDDDAVSLQLESRILFAVLRAIQEGLTNITRHSQSRNALVHITLQDSTLVILIQDDGMGFNVDAVECGHGLNNIRLRMQLIEGRAAISSFPGKGCKLTLELKLKTGNHEEKDTECPVDRRSCCSA